MFQLLNLRDIKTLIDAGIIEDKDYEEHLDKSVSVEFFLRYVK